MNPMNKWGAMLCLFMAAFTCTTSFAQIDTYFTENGATTTVTQCAGHLYDGGGGTNPYTDESGTPYTDILTICPQVPSTQSVKITFQAFDVATGDKLMAFDGDNINAPMFTANSPLAGSGFGSSVADSPGGGWVQASCENLSGCVTFKFERNGDHVRGAGFQASVYCAPRENTYLDCSRVDEFNGVNGEHVVVADCGSGMSLIDIPIPAYFMCDIAGVFKVQSSCEVDLPLTVDADGMGFLTGSFPMGMHTVIFSSLPYGDKQCVAYINVLTPPLACSDNLNVSLSTECLVTITPDLILEDICEPEYIVRPIDGALIPAFTYEITINDLGEAQVIGTTTEGYPLVDFSNVPCGTMFNINARRTYISDVNCNGVYFNGYDYDDSPLIDECWGQIIVEDKVDPVILNGPPALAIPCYENTGILDILNGMDPDSIGAGGDLYLPYLNTYLSVPGAPSLNTTENCYFGYSATVWTENERDCAEAQIVTDWNGDTYEAAVFTAYTRELSVTDRCGNYSSYTQEVFVLQPSFVAPVPELELPCGVDIDPHALQAAWSDWLAAGRPANDPRAAYASFMPNFDQTATLVTDNDPLNDDDYYVTDASGDEIPIDLEHATCGYAIDWTDGNPIASCGGGYKVFREWTVYNWCNGMIEFSASLPQVIKVIDADPPTILDSIPYVITDNTGADCKGSVTFYPPNIVDACSNVTTFVQIGTDTRVFDPSGVTFNDFAIGEEVVIKITATDACGNSTNRQDTVMLQDIVPPNTICELIRTVALNNECTVQVPAESFDDGSYDSCGGIMFEVARMDSDSNNDGFPEEEDYSDKVTFSAADLSNECGGTVMVVLRVSDTNGNSNICMVEVLLQDKIPPMVEDIYKEVTCDDMIISSLITLATMEDEASRASRIINLLTTQQIGTLNGSDNCSAASDLDIVIINTDFSGFDATCRNGILEYYFQVYDNCANQSAIKQGLIVVKESSDWLVNLPMDVEIYCDGDDSADNFEPSTLEDMMQNHGCDNWGLEVNEETFETTSDACYKRVYTYHFINWCTWNPSNSETAIVERPDALITNPLHTVALRFRDLYQNDPATGALLQDATGQFLLGADGVNDIDDGNEDFDFNASQSNLVPVYIYRSYDVNSNGSKSYQETRDGLSPIELPLSVFDGQTGRIRLEDEILTDADEAINFDVYDVTNSLIDGDFVIVDNFDANGQSMPAYNLTSQFSGNVQTYISAQSYGNFAYRQIVKIYDTSAPTVDVLQDGPFCGGENVPSDGDVCSAPVEVRFLVDDTCTPFDDLNVTYQLEAFGGSPINDPFGQIIHLGEGLYRISGTYPMLNGGLSAIHTFIINITDGCGNEEIKEIPFEVRDCHEPTAYCLFGLSTTMSDAGEVLLWANDFDAGSSDNCTAIEDIRLTFADPDLYPDSTGRTFRCDVGEVGTVQVYLWAQDRAGNKSFCETFVTIQGNGGCPDPSGSTATISGAIMTINDEPLESVEMTLSGEAGEMAELMGNGEYTFGEVEIGYDYTVIAHKNEGALNGVSTFDLVLMNRHVLGTRPLETAHELIAADINNSGNVSTFVMVLLRKLILNVDTEFTHNTSWKFIPSSFEFIDPTNPWATPIPEIININNFSAAVADANFVAIKIGDVNGNASATNNIQDLEGRSQWSNKELQVRRRILSDGFQLDFYATDLQNLDGFQFNLDFDEARLAFRNFQSGVLEASNFGWTKTDQGVINVSWNSFGTHTWTANDKLFSLTFDGGTSVDLERALDIGQTGLLAEAYDKQGTFFGWEMKWLGGEVDDVVLYQNIPNPFQQQTEIAFELPTAGAATLEIRDVTGKVFTSIQGNYPSGYNSITLAADKLPNAGVFYYSLQTDTQQLTKKMILIK